MTSRSACLYMPICQSIKLSTNEIADVVDVISVCLFVCLSGHVKLAVVKLLCVVVVKVIIEHLQD